MEPLILKNRNNTFGEVITGFDFSSFKYEYEKNNERSISFTVEKNTQNADIFNKIVNEMLLEWKGQLYPIKSTSIKFDGVKLVNEVIGKHIFMEFQNHYIQKDINSNDSSTEDKKMKINLQDYLNFGFENNQLNYTFEIIGDFDKSVYIDELGNKNGIEFLAEGAELFNYIYFADNKKFYIYDESTFYKMSNTPLIYTFNSSEAQATITTTELKTYIQGFGGKLTNKDITNYNPIKPPNISYSGNFIKEGTWRTEEVGASYHKTFECKHGKEELSWTLKKMSKGGVLDVYLDGELVGTYKCYSKNATTERIVIARNLSQGQHTFKAVFRGAIKGIDYEKSNPCMYVGTEKSTVLNLSANLKGNELYEFYAEHKSDNFDLYPFAEAPTVYSDNVKNKDELQKEIKAQLNDQPTVEITTNYLGSYEDRKYIQDEDISENSMVRFIHDPLGYDIDLKVVKLTKSHPILQQPVEVDFSNSPKDILRIQQNFNRQIRKIDNLGGSQSESSFSMPENYSDIVGVTILDD